jgi:choline kinase
MSRVPYQAVILAAGRGSRLGERTVEMPKALLPLGPRSLHDPTETCFLRRQCEILHELGVGQVVVAVGYLKDQVAEAVARWRLPVELVENTWPAIDQSGSLHSFQYAARSGLGILDGRAQTLLMDGDIVYDRRVLQRLLDAPVETSLLVCSKYLGEDEEVLVYGSSDRPTMIGKGLTAELVQGAPCLGEAVGVVKFAPEDHALVWATMNWMLGDPDAPADSLKRRGFGPARQATEHEELTQRLMLYRKISAVTFGAELPFMEVDGEQEYRLCREQFYPRLLQQEAGLAAGPLAAAARGAEAGGAP